MAANLIHQCVAGVISTTSSNPMYVPRLPDPQPAPPVIPPKPVASKASSSAPITAAEPCFQEQSVAPTTSLVIDLQNTKEDAADSYNTKEDTESLCIVCWASKPSWMCVPCGHIAMCRPCSQAVKEQTNVCPVCQQAIDSLQQVFFA